MKLTPVLLAITFILIALITTGCLQYKEVQFGGVKDYKVLSFNGSQLELEVKAEIDNPNNYKIKIADADFGVKMNNSSVGSGKLKSPLVIKRKSKEIHTVVLKANIENGLKTGLDGVMAMISGKGMNFEAEGHVKAKAFMLSKKVDFKFPFSVNPSIFGK